MFKWYTYTHARTQTRQSRNIRMRAQIRARNQIHKREFALPLIVRIQR